MNQTNSLSNASADELMKYCSTSTIGNVLSLSPGRQTALRKRARQGSGATLWPGTGDHARNRNHSCRVSLDCCVVPDLALLPSAGASDFAKVCSLIMLVHDLGPEQGLKHVFHRDESSRATIIILHQGYVGFSLHQDVEKRVQVRRFGDARHVSDKFLCRPHQSCAIVGYGVGC
jgi:hypothetical protein